MKKFIIIISIVTIFSLSIAGILMATIDREAVINSRQHFSELIRRTFQQPCFYRLFNFNINADTPIMIDPDYIQISGKNGISIASNLQEETLRFSDYWMDDDFQDFMKSEVKIWKEKISKEKVQEINIDLTDIDILFLPSQKNEILIELLEQEKRDYDSEIYYKIQNGVLKIFQDSSDCFFFSFFRPTRYLIIEIPTDIQSNLLNTTIKNISGDVHIQKIDLTSLEILTTSGNVKIENFPSSSPIKIETISGEIKLKEFESVPQLTVDTMSGSIKILNGHINIMELESLSGDIFFNSSITEGSISTTSGDIVLSSKILKDTYVIYETVSGDLSDVSKQKLDNNDGLLKILKIHTISGDLEFD